MRAKLRFAAAFVVGGLLAFGSSAANAQSGEITVWSWNIAAEALDMLVPDFNKKYPDVKVTVVNMGHGDVRDKALAGCAAGGTDLPGCRHDREQRGRSLLGALPRLLRQPQGVRRREIQGRLRAVQMGGAFGWRRDLFAALGFRPGRRLLPARPLREGRRRPGLHQDLGRLHRGRQEDPRRDRRQGEDGNHQPVRRRRAGSGRSPTSRAAPTSIRTARR